MTNHVQRLAKALSMDSKALSMDSTTLSQSTGDGSYERGSHWELRKRRTTGSLSNGASSQAAAAATVHRNPTAVEVHEWVQTSHCHQHDNTLRHGHLLRWMDITACLSGLSSHYLSFPSSLDCGL